MTRNIPQIALNADYYNNYDLVHAKYAVVSDKKVAG